MDRELTKELIKRFCIEYRKRDRSGIYALTSRELAYNSNKIEGSTLTKEQTASLFDSGMLPQNEDYYRAKDIEEMNGHFLMFNKMLVTLQKRPNIIGMHDTTSPAEVSNKMAELLSWYEGQEVSLAVLAEFHARYEAIHPFQDGNGRTGRIILFRECLTYDIMPVILEDDNGMEYIQSLALYRNNGNLDGLVKLFEKEQAVYRQQVEKFLL